MEELERKIEFLMNQVASQAKELEYLRKEIQRINQKITFDRNLMISHGIS